MLTKTVVVRDYRVGESPATKPRSPKIHKGRLCESWCLGVFVAQSFLDNFTTTLPPNR